MNNGNLKRAALYLRVSSPSQVRTDYDPEGSRSPPSARRASARAKPSPPR
jgi:hypothetical protein